ncbi:MAG: menaquinone biosynthesis decarboxylase [Bacteroidota bacterium]
MAYQSLQDFIHQLEKEDELVRIQSFVDPVLEITEITDRVSKSRNGGKALLFENTGTGFPLLINAFGSEKRVSRALGASNLDEIGRRISKLFQSLMSPKQGLMDKLKLLPLLSEMSSWMPKVRSGRGACQEIIMEKPDLSLLPILKCWPSDGGRFITLPMVVTKDAESGVRNVGMYRMQVFEKNVTGMHWHRHKVGARHFLQYKALNRKMPVAVALGGDPAHIYAATAPLPDNIDEFMLSGFLRQKKVELVKAITQDIEVPADADFIIEGYIDPEEDFLYEGPFGDHTGFYSLEDYFPAFHVTCITHRKKAVYPATIVGIPPQEDAWMAKATERIFLNPIRFAIAPEITDMHMPDEGVAHNLTLVKIDKTYPGQAQKVAHALWGAGQMMFNKVMVITDKNIPLSNTKNLIHALIREFNPLTDLFFNTGPLDILDHSSNEPAFGGKLGINCTQQMTEEKGWQQQQIVHTVNPGKKKAIRQEAPFQTLYDQLLKDGIPIRWFGLEKDGNKKENIDIVALGDEFEMFDAKINIIIDTEIITQNISLLVWITLANIDPVRDCMVFKNNDKATLVIDARRKSKYANNFYRKWPNYVASDPYTIQKINDKWTQLGLGERVASPSEEILSWGFGTAPVIPDKD